eukprot:g5897.t1
MSSLDRWRVSFEDSTGTTPVKQIPTPPGFSANPSREMTTGSTSMPKKKDVEIQKLQQVLQSRAVAPFKQVGVLCFMMYMSANTIQIFTILTTFSGIGTSLQAIMKSGDMFKPDSFGQLDVFTPRLLYCLIHMLAVIFGLYKLNTIGLLPTHASDWFSALKAPVAAEYSFMG